MTTTGWTGEPPEAEAPAMPVTALLVDHQERRASVLETALARSRADEAREALAEAAAAADPDERAASLVARGVMPGMLSGLGQRLADAEAELQAEREKIARGERRAEQVRGMLERGQIGGLAAAQLMDGDFGDADRAAQLERRADRLRRELAAAQAMVAPPRERVSDSVERAGRHAHAVFVETTRQRMADVQAGRPGPRPFGSVSRAGFAARTEPVTCGECIAAGATAEESFLIHSDPQPPQFTGEDLAGEAGRYGETGRVPMIYR